MISNKRLAHKIEIGIFIFIVILLAVFVYTITRNDQKVKEISLGINESYLLGNGDLTNGYYYDKEDWNTVSIEKNGKVTGISEGISIVYLKNASGNVLKKYLIDVKKNETEKIKITNIKLEDSALVKEKETYQLKYEVEPKGYNEKILWTSQNEEIATVDSSGKIYGVKSGETVVECSVNNGEYLRESKITVLKKDSSNSENSNDAKKRELSVSKSLINISIGETYDIIYSKQNIDNVIFTTNNSSVATVDNGKITGIGSGTATITIMSDDKEVSSSIIVYVTEKTDIESILLNQSQINVIQNQTYQLKATILPAGVNQNVTWISSNPEVATAVNGNVVGLQAGSTTITATAIDGKQAVCVVNVVLEKISVQSISLNKTSLSLPINATDTLLVSVYPTNAVVEEISWKSSNPSVATVNKGKVIALKEGTTVITAKTSNGKEAIANVTVKNIAVDNIKIKNGDNININVGASEILVAEVLPTNSSNKTLKWTSSNTSIVKINSSGKVTGLKTGTATITATSVNGKKQSIKVTIIRDTTPPTINYDHIAATYLNENVQFVKIEVSDKGGSGLKSYTVNVIYNGKMVVNVANLKTATYNVAINKEGIWIVNVKAIDNAGNTNNVKPLTTSGFYTQTYKIGGGVTQDATAIFFGDSITYGSGNKVTVNGKTIGYSWANYIGDNYDLKSITNAGRSGWFISNNGDKFITSVVKEYNGTSYDYVIMHGGCNDIASKISLGTFDADDFSGKYNDKTFIGGLETYIYTVINQWPYSKIGYIINYQTPKNEKRKYEISKPYYDAMKKVLKKWNIKYIDLFDGKANNGVKYSDILKVSSSTYLPDTLHLNGNGYKVITPYIYEFMSDLEQCLNTHKGCNPYSIISQ